MGQWQGPSEDHLDALFHALSDPTRRAILERLADEGELRVAELREPLDLAKSTVSQHLGVLARAGLVRREGAGADRVYWIRDASVGRLRRWLGETLARSRRRQRFALDAPFNRPGD